MTQDTAQLNLNEPAQCDWDTAYSGSKYVAPPPALGPDGKPIHYQGALKAATLTDPDDGFLNYMIDLEINAPGQSYNGARARVWASTRPFTKDDGSGTRVAVKGNPNKLGSILRSAGLQAKPQTNADYQASIRAVLAQKKLVTFTLDWEAKNKDTGEVVKGFNAFPVDPATGNRKPILKAGDTVNILSAKGEVIGTSTVKSEVLFANPRVKYFQDAKGATR